jgi:hypothetical protein
LGSVFQTDTVKVEGLSVVAGYGFQEDIAILNLHAVDRTVLCETYDLWKIRGCGE